MKITRLKLKVKDDDDSDDNGVHNCFVLLPFDTNQRNKMHTYDIYCFNARRTGTSSLGHKSGLDSTVSNVLVVSKHVLIVLDLIFC